MFFLDSSGFFSLVGLLVQCSLAWLLAALFAVVLRQGRGPDWFRQWFWAYLCLAIALAAVSARYVFAYRHVALVDWVEENAPLTRVLYAIYQPGKLCFILLVLRGAARLRDVPPIPLGPTLMGAVVAYGLAGAWFGPTIEWLLLLQAPMMVMGAVFATRWLLPFQRERRDIGSWIVIAALRMCAFLWAVYAVAIVCWLAAGKPSESLWLVPLQFNSYFDLTGQVVLGTGMIVMVVQDSQHATQLAHRERDQLRDQLARDEKLRALGTLVSGVAHELNNPLTSILGFGEYLSSPDPVVRENAARIVREQAERCRGIVRSLSALAGQRASQQESVDLVQLIDRVVRGFLPQLSAGRIEIRTVATLDLPTVCGDRVGLEQVLANLIANAVHVTPPGGSITVRASHDPREIRLSVLDSGPGVPAEVAERMFEPFFTTKAPGSGTGLGLALARALVRAHQGDLVLVDRPTGSGAEFLVRLPVAANSPVAEDPVEPIVAPPGAGGAGLELLVIDDEPLLRELIATSARRAGWRVSEAVHGEAGMALIEGGRTEFDAVVCDLRMPGLSGLQIHDRLAQRDPELLRRFVFITGDSSSAEATEFVARSPCALIEKPFDIDRLLREFTRVARRTTGVL